MEPIPCPQGCCELHSVLLQERKINNTWAIGIFCLWFDP